MTFECKIPELGENITSGTVTSILVKLGDKIEKDQPIVELETEKAVLEVPSEKNGSVEKILIKEGQDVQIGQTVILIKTLETNATKEEIKEQPEIVETVEKPLKSPEQKKTVQNKENHTHTFENMEIKLPDLGENITSGTVTSVLVKINEKIEKDQPIVEIETEKAVVEVPSPESGIVQKILVNEGDELGVGKPILFLSGSHSAKQQSTEVVIETPIVSKASSNIPAEPASAQSEKKRAVKSDKRVAAAAPSVRRFAREIGVDIHDVPGSGPGKRISIQDVKDFSKKLHQEKSTSASIPIAKTSLPDFSKWGETVRESMSKVRYKTAEHLSNAWITIPHVTQFDRADITELEKLRKEYSPKAEALGGKLTMTAILLKVIASSFKVFPQFNASVDMEQNEIIFKKYINIGVAVDTDRGLLVPVIRNVNQKNLIELSVELSQIAKRARDRKLSLEDMQGGNFTISNLGGIGGTAFTPIINAPEVALLGISRAKYEPVYINNNFEPRLLLPLSLSYDHRIIDGADGARFIRWVVEALEQPFAMLLEG